MENLLEYANIEDPCGQCQQGVSVTLEQILLEQQTEQEWQSPRLCPNCSTPRPYAAAIVPAHELEQLAAAWQALSAILAEHGVTLRVGR
jgi:hypothetical protein